MAESRTKDKSPLELDVVCAWCGCFIRTKVSSKPIVDGVSHGICLQCKETIIEEFKNELKRSADSE